MTNLDQDGSSVCANHPQTPNTTTTTTVSVMDPPAPLLRVQSVGPSAAVGTNPQTTKQPRSNQRLNVSYPKQAQDVATGLECVLSETDTKSPMVVVDPPDYSSSPPVDADGMYLRAVYNEWTDTDGDNGSSSSGSFRARSIRSDTTTSRKSGKSGCGDEYEAEKEASQHALTTITTTTSYTEMKRSKGSPFVTKKAENDAPPANAGLPACLSGWTEESSYPSSTSSSGTGGGGGCNSSHTSSGSSSCTSHCSNGQHHYDHQDLTVIETSCHPDMVAWNHNAHHDGVVVMEEEEPELDNYVDDDDDDSKLQEEICKAIYEDAVASYLEGRTVKVSNESLHEHLQPQLVPDGRPSHRSHQPQSLASTSTRLSSVDDVDNHQHQSHYYSRQTTNMGPTPTIPEDEPYRSGSFPEDQSFTSESTMVEIIDVEQLAADAEQPEGSHLDQRDQRQEAKLFSTQRTPYTLETRDDDDEEAQWQANETIASEQTRESLHSQPKVTKSANEAEVRETRSIEEQDWWGPQQMEDNTTEKRNVLFKCLGSFLSVSMANLYSLSIPCSLFSKHAVVIFRSTKSWVFYWMQFSQFLFARTSVGIALKIRGYLLFCYFPYSCRVRS